MQPVHLTPLLATAGFGWLYYRRIRRHFGWQRWRPGRVRLRLAILLLVAVGLGAVAASAPHTMLGMLAGAVIGAGLGGLGVHLVRIEPRNGLPGYLPNPWIGGALSLLLVGRLAWRWAHGAFAFGSGASDPQAIQHASPLTLGIAATLVAYALANAAWLSWKMRGQPPADLDVRAP